MSHSDSSVRDYRDVGDPFATLVGSARERESSPSRDAETKKDAPEGALF